ncbi:MAG TPA: hypothetical protein VEU51_03775 [Candidatus Acidoferrales bacterium]|nr:hypothetical protein [Candidatus Acidoferrales bacterium]
MKRLIALATLLTVGVVGIAQAGTRVDVKDSEKARQEADMHARYDHPKTEVVNNKDLKIDITRDAIMHSCCMPPNLVVAGTMTNVGARPIDYVHLNFAFENNDGKILHAESLYNHKAESLGDDESVRRILNEKPHFEPIQPGESDTFAFSVPLPILPPFSKVELFSTDMRP